VYTIAPAGATALNAAGREWAMSAWGAESHSR
jgi:hypothetical protein